MANIKKIAHFLVFLAFKGNDDVAKVLKEEYGIEPKQDNHVRRFECPVGRLEAEEFKQQIAVMQVRLKEEQERKQKPYAPRKIGKPCGFPKNMRRK